MCAARNALRWIALTAESPLPLHLVIDPTCMYLVTASGDRGWAGETTQTVLVHEIKT